MIVIVFGLPGVGKSYFARALAKRLGWEYFGTDEIRRKMSNVAIYTKQKKEEVYSELLKKITPNSQIVFDGTFSQKEVRHAFVLRGSELNQSIRFIEINCEEEVIKKRLQTQRPDSDADFEVYQFVKNEFEPMKEPHLILRSDIYSLDQMVDKAYETIFK